VTKDIVDMLNKSILLKEITMQQKTLAKSPSRRPGFTRGVSSARHSDRSEKWGSSAIACGASVVGWFEMDFFAKASFAACYFFF